MRFTGESIINKCATFRKLWGNAVQSFSKADFFPTVAGHTFVDAVCGRSML